MSAFFVTATGTDIGKTFVTAGLVHHLRSQARAASALKPVISGFDMARAEESDSGVLLNAMGSGITQENIGAISPWRFKAPLSPDMAAAKEGGAVDFDALVKFSRQTTAHAEGTFFIEGVGGAMTPITARHTVLDWMAALRLPLIVVTGSYLGTISHTLTTLDVLSRRDLAIALLVVNESEGSTVPLADTAEAIARFTPGVRLVALPRRAGPSAFAEIAAAIH